MPADPSYSQAKRRSNKLTGDEEVDLRRSRGEISCAECRRLKLKCDKKLPCGSCVRRGCPSICPNGSLSTGQGTRFVLADTTQLHAKIAEMGQRIRQLEDALTIFQSGVSSEVHPLLREELLSIKFGPEKGYVPEKEPTQPTPDSIDAFGTMTLTGGDLGAGKYFGPSAGSETLLLVGAEFEPPPDDEVYQDTHLVSNEIARLMASFPFGTDEASAEIVLDQLFDHLPSQPRAWSLCETYMEQASWAFRPVKRDEIIDDILTPTYKALKQRQATGSLGSHNVSTHKLAVLFIVFSLGALVDLTLEPFNKEADTYYQLCRACLSLPSVFDSPEIATVQAVVLMATYHSMAAKRYTMDSLWTLMSLGAKLAQSVGNISLCLYECCAHLINLYCSSAYLLDRDSARWNMDAKTVQRRRSLFWELYSTEAFNSLALGRPPSIRLSYVDCEFPDDEDATIDSDGKTLVGYYRWKYEFLSEIFSSVLELTLTAQAPQYQTILDLDRKVREKTLPPHLNVFMSPEDEQCTPSVYMRRCMLSQYRSITLLYIHRSFFAQAMLDHPVNPLRSPYAPSFLAAYRCASGVIKSTLNHYDRFPELCGRWWGIWTHLFSAAVIVGSIVTRSPSSSMASSAFIELGLACDLFAKGAMQSRRARSGLAILFKMRDRAFQVYSQFRAGNVSPVGGILSVGKPDYGDDELALFGGQTRVLVSKLLSSKRIKRKGTATPTSPQNLASPGFLSNSDHQGISANEGSPDVHPSLIDYLSIFPPTNTGSTIESSLAPSITTPPYRQQHFQAPTSANIQEPEQISYSNQHPWSAWQDPLPGVVPMMSDSQMLFTSHVFPQSNNVGEIKADSPANLMDLGMMMSGESGMDEQWMSFMRDSGLLEERVSDTADYAEVARMIPHLP